MRNWAGNGICCQDVLMRLKQQVTPGQKHTHALCANLLCSLIVAKETHYLSERQIIITHICYGCLHDSALGFI